VARCDCDAEQERELELELERWSRNPILTCCVLESESGLYWIGTVNIAECLPGCWIYRRRVGAVRVIEWRNWRKTVRIVLQPPVLNLQVADSTIRSVSFVRSIRRAIAPVLPLEKMLENLVHHDHFRFLTPQWCVQPPPTSEFPGAVRRNRWRSESSTPDFSNPDLGPHRRQRHTRCTEALLGKSVARSAILIPSPLRPTVRSFMIWKSSS
jgi:hypothetical protein